MTLQNLQAIKRLQAHTTDAAAIRKLLDAAQRNLADARVTAIGEDNRFDAGYKCVMQCAMLGLWASGYRTATSQPGHHQTAIQSLGLTMGVATSTMVVLDGRRKVRNLSDYVGDPVTEAALASCLEEADKLLAHTRQWLRDHHPKLLGDA
jgi:class 3 adenylate cyclase